MVTCLNCRSADLELVVIFATGGHTALGEELLDVSVRQGEP
jgi:hypothetical protein